MLEPEKVRQFQRMASALGSEVSGGDPESLAQLRDIVSMFQAEEIWAARALHTGEQTSSHGPRPGYSWTELAKAQGVSRQAVHQRYGVDPRHED